MRTRLLAMLVLACLAASPRPATAADLTLSANFLEFAPFYLQTARDCSYRVLAAIPIPCEYEDISEKIRSVASTPGDKLVADNLDSWVASLVSYSQTASDEKADPQKLAQMQNAIKHMTDVCAAELIKALKDQNIAEKSPCTDVLNAM